jgi:DNA-binding GntR family transcriptional regulator
MLSNQERPIQRIRDEHQALAILQILCTDVANGQANERVLAACLDIIALGGSRLNVRAALQRLGEQRLIVIETVEPCGESVVVAAITDQGQRVAEGKTRLRGLPGLAVIEADRQI